jgi:hypothetical protein
MEMVFSCEGGVKFDDKIDVGQIKTARCDVGGDQDGRILVLSKVC